MRSASRWLIAALAAAGAALIGALSFSSIGGLTPEDDLTRLLVAAAGAGTALVGLATSIALLVRLQYPLEVTYARVRRSAEHGPLARACREEPALVQGRTGPTEFFDEFDRLRARVWRARAGLRAAEDELERLTGLPPGPASTTETGRARTAVQQARARLDAAEAAWTARGAPMKVAVDRLTGLAHLARLERRSAWLGGAALVSALLASGGVLVLAWAAGPASEDDEPSDVVAGSPVSATMVLTAAGAERFSPVLGQACVAAAMAEGVDVVALARAADGTLEVVVVGDDGPCLGATRLTVPPAAGSVTAPPVLVPAPAPSA